MNHYSCYKPIRTLIFFPGLFLFAAFQSWPGDRVVQALIEPAPAIETYSLEGLPVSFRPAPGQYLLIQFWKPKDSQSIEFNKETLSFYRRFHEKGLAALSVCCDASEDDAAKTAERWKIDWPQVLNDEEKPPLTEQFGVTAIPRRFLVNDAGKVVLDNPSGNDAHEKIAELLKVSLDSLPIPPPPQEVQIQDTRSIGSMRESPPPPFSGGSLAIQDRDMSDPRLLFGTPEERKQADETIKIFRKISLALFNYSLDRNGGIPNWLSDLYPDYLSDDVSLICPSDPTPLSKYVNLTDRNVPSSFTFEFAPVTISGTDNRQQKIKLLEKYGDRVPIVRCFNFPRPLCLTYGGEIFFMDEIWERIIPPGKTVNDPDAKVRRQLMTIAVTLNQYKKEKGDVPEELENLSPDFLADPSVFINPVTNEPFSYQFSSSRKNTIQPEKGATYREWKNAQLAEFGEIVPIVRAADVLENEQVINLSYGGEIWQSQSEWEKDVITPIVITPPSVLRVEEGSEESALQARGWLQDPLRTESPVNAPEMMMPLRGEWNFAKNTKQLRMIDSQKAPTTILFSPLIDKGEIRFKARVPEGQEGIKVIFGYTSPSRFFTMSIGEFANQTMTVRKWSDLKGLDVKTVSEKISYSFPRNEWHDIRITVDDGSRTAECFIDGKSMLTYKSNESPAGRLGLGTWYTAADFENIVIRGSETPPVTKPEATPSENTRNANIPVASFISARPRNAKILSASLILENTRSADFLSATSSQEKTQNPDIRSIPPASRKPPQSFEKIGIVVKWDEKTNQGYRIYAVSWNSPAFNANLKSDDLIVAINGTAFHPADDAEATRGKAEEILNHQGDPPWTLGVIRVGKETQEDIPIQPVPVQKTTDPKSFDGPYGTAIMGPNGMGIIGTNQPIFTINIPKEWKPFPTAGSLKIQDTTDTLSVAGLWNIDGQTIFQRDIQSSSSMLLFSPWIEKGEIRLRANPTGETEGVLIFLGFTYSTLPYLVWNIGGNHNTTSTLEKWDINILMNGNPVVFNQRRFTLPQNQWHDIRLIVNSETSEVKGYVDRQQLFNIGVAEPLSGRFGIGTMHTSASFDRIEIISASDTVQADGETIAPVTPELAPK